jgi:hypothetical protein
LLTAVPGQPALVNVTKRMPTMLVLSIQAPEENGGVPITAYRIEYKEKQVIEFAIGRLGFCLSFVQCR